MLPLYQSVLSSRHSIQGLRIISHRLRHGQGMRWGRDEYGMGRYESLYGRGILKDDSLYGIYRVQYTEQIVSFSYYYPSPSDEKSCYSPHYIIYSVSESRK